MIALEIDPDATEPPFEQVRRQVAAAAADGSLPPGHRLPTVRALAADLGLAVNTVARAYRELEADGVVETQGRRGTFVTAPVALDGATRAAVEQVVADARRAGLSRDQVVRLVEEVWGA
ncbi:GntR family transcriptional regulator [Aeromicrobium erythreum]|uniref:GntR family transcriptional regulator n=1 Tax=Aeromicrobium erythreum TaxID=2041 RepID=A0A0U3TEC5_9ACTN|nr:GntR family transcriptional regulator [Aeromicrobium erythreum]ALX03895.1 GntR family transcriptional regulator [Aeromicrobium erythreum]